MCEECACTGPGPGSMMESGPQTPGVYREDVQASSARADGQAGSEVSKGGVGEDSVRNELTDGGVEKSGVCIENAFVQPKSGGTFHGNNCDTGGTAVPTPEGAPLDAVCSLCSSG